MRLDVRKVVGRLANLDDLRHDLPASLVVFLVAVPLSLGIAVASDAPVMSGLIAAVVGGVVAGAVGGSALMVSGPAAGLTLVVAGFISQFGWRATCAVTAAAGLLQIGLGLGRLARVALAITPTVVHAMLAGIGVTIALGQLHVLLGGGPGSSPVENLVDLPRQVTDAYHAPTLVGLAAIAVLLVWPRLPGSRGSRLRAVPAPLVAVAGLTVVAEVLRLDVARVDMPGSPLDAVQLPVFPQGRWPALAVAAVTLAVVASVETLVSAVAMEKMRPDLRTDYDRVLVGQGAANAVSGILGGLPVSGVIARSSTNMAAGAVSSASALLHGLWILVFSLLLVGVVERIPMTVLAALLVVVGLRLVRPAPVRAAWAQGELPVYLVTAVGVVVLGLLEGVLAGVVVSVALMLRRLIRARVRVEPAVSVAHPDWTVVAQGNLSFLSVPQLSRVLADIPSGSSVALDLRVGFLDHAVADHLRAWKQRHEAAGGTVLVDEHELAPRTLHS